MKNYLIILLIISTKCFSQSASDRQIIDSIIEVDNLPTVISIQSKGYEKLEELVARKSFYNKHFPKNKVNLTNDEMVFVMKEIKKNKNFIFSKEMFPNELLISNDTLISYSSNKAKIWRKEYEAIFESKDSVKMKQFRKEKPYPTPFTYVNFFSRPIYFRDNAFCIIYYARLCNFHVGMGGCSEVIICRKENGIWKKFIQIPIGCY